MALISIDEAKEYLRVDSADEDAVINSLISAATNLVKDVGRVPEDKWTAVIEDEDDPETNALRSVLRVASLYALGYLFEHREEADHHELTITLRNLLFSIREGVV